MTTVWWGSGSRSGGIVPIIQHGKTKYHVCRLATQGWLVFRFDWLNKKAPFRAEAARKELLTKINDIPGQHFDESVLTRRARVPFDSLTTGESVDKLKAALAWLIDQIRSECEREGEPK